jgi:hypothetical protein
MHYDVRDLPQVILHESDCGVVGRAEEEHGFQLREDFELAITGGLDHETVTVAGDRQDGIVPDFVAADVPAVRFGVDLGQFVGNGLGMLQAGLAGDQVGVQDVVDLARIIIVHQ